MPGTKETKEVLVAANEIALFLVKRLRDGVSFDDAVAFYSAVVSDAEFKAKIFAAYENVALVPSELSDLNLLEVVDLAQTQVAYVPKLVAALKG